MAYFSVLKIEAVSAADKVTNVHQNTSYDIPKHRYYYTTMISVLISVVHAPLRDLRFIFTAF
jgi:hypothetical protein